MSDLPSDLPGRYAVAVDTRDAAALAALFTPDAEFVQPPAVTRGEAVVTVGGDSIAAAILGGTAHLHSTHHAVHQQVLDTDGDTATGQVYCLAHHLYRNRRGELRDNAIAIRYQDSYRVVDGRWAIARRELVVDFAEDREVTIPGA
ncbi:nuclear transport factor 2 family protein [Rhodococcus sp. NPDC127528]|uniref:nuclear transport factor 2 family protein n=1 Tax=unclassified Rhodococcus (in: high G+C Gram-positive bacteria) TaxID=192944 RepID=UPI00362AD1C0